jgi:hypothetical protein
MTRFKIPVVSLLALGVLLCASCTAEQSKVPADPTPSPPNADKYPGLTITGPPLSAEALALVDVVARRDYLVKQMAEKEPKSYAALRTVMTQVEADAMAKTLAANHDYGYKAKGWGSLEIISAAEYADGAVVISCQDSRGWTLTAVKNNKTEVIQGGVPEIRETSLNKESGNWVVNSDKTRKPKPGVSAEAKCK